MTGWLVKIYPSIDVVVIIFIIIALVVIRVRSEHILILEMILSLLV